MDPGARALRRAEVAGRVRTLDCFGSGNTPELALHDLARNLDGRGLSASRGEVRIRLMHVPPNLATARPLWVAEAKWEAEP